LLRTEGRYAILASEVWLTSDDARWTRAPLLACTSLQSVMFVLGTFQNRAKVVDSFCGDGSCLAGGFLKTVNWNLNGANFRVTVALNSLYC